MMTNMSIFVSLQVFINSYCSMLFRFTNELRLSSHTNKSLNNKVFWITLYRRKIPYLRWQKSNFNVFSLTESFTNKPNTKKKTKKKQDQKSLALISFNV